MVHSLRSFPLNSFIIVINDLLAILKMNSIGGFLTFAGNISLFKFIQKYSTISQTWPIST